jgi:hypothetical protein
MPEIVKQLYREVMIRNVLRTDYEYVKYWALTRPYVLFCIIGTKIRLVVMTEHDHERAVETYRCPECTEAGTYVIYNMTFLVNDGTHMDFIEDVRDLCFNREMLNISVRDWAINLDEMMDLYPDGYRTMISEFDNIGMGFMGIHHRERFYRVEESEGIKVDEICDERFEEVRRMRKNKSDVINVLRPDFYREEALPIRNLFREVRLKDFIV